MSHIEDSSLNEINNDNNNNNISNDDSNSNNNNNNNLNSNSNNNNNLNISDLVSKNGTLLNLSGINLSTENGIQLIKNISQQYPDLIKINLYNCNLTELPKELYNFKLLSSLDIRGNKFQNFEQLISDLSKISNLTDLQIDLDDQNQVLLTLSSIPKLILLNGKSTKSSFTIVDIGVNDIEDISLQNYLDEYNEIVNNLNNKDKTHSYANRFQNKLYEEGEKIKNCLNKKVPNYIYANVTLKSQ